MLKLDDGIQRKCHYQSLVVDLFQTGDQLEAKDVAGSSICQ